ncbi:MAG: sugar phosphate isomerase/epimerase family protein [Nitrososphaerota archaeon]|nr:sugar phosphate isomerase/epimerase [Candidatus Calditenuaceae archaeon]MDW8073035.1 sugar phosphate isomerase/epimerase family protein [Nitrososphaerota archaeon]
MNIGIVSDEISQNPEHAFKVAKRLGATHIEIRDVRGKNVCLLSDAEILELRSLASKLGLQISNIDSYAFKVYIHDEAGIDWSLSTLERAIEITKLLDLNFTRVFTFWWHGGLAKNLERITEILSRALDLASSEGITLAVENEYSCMVGTGKETRKLLEAVNSRWLKVLWDPGNAFFAREEPYPEGYEQVRDAIVHVHLKDAVVENGAFKFKPIGSGAIDYLGQLRSLGQSFRGVLSLETHYTPPGGNKEDGTVESFNGLLNILSKLRAV